MKSKEKYLIINLLAITVTVVCIYAFYLNQKRKEVLNANCTAVMEYHDAMSGFSSEINVVLVLSPQEYGYIDMSGQVTYEGRGNTLNRKIKFAYEKEVDDIYMISGLTLIKQTSDTAPDGLMDRIFFTISHEKERNMTVKRVSNAYVIGNLHSPVFMCVVK
ncbi:MAG: hypothetical protein KIC48_16555 [Citrobacter sp.]|uniref:hypothetical protein n=1 Tax=Enterobacterales TaxID=91347 RepID=UPI002577BE2F|nr:MULTISPECIES: hypothetical protein [unclassified Citrobacter]MBS6004100.1 hypothetical protein [Citrobacter sp.]MDM3447128.1 hypothetical protein [Citrobacter sp. Cb009]